METNKVLVVVDMQNDFIEGSLATKEAQAIVPNVVNKINEYKKNEWQVYATQDTHYEDYLETSEGKKLSVPHCIKDTWGWEINSAVKEALGDSEIKEKSKFGASYISYEIEIDNILDSDKVLEVEYVGLYTDTSVISNVLLHKTATQENSDTIVKVDSSCCAGTTLEKHNAALEVMKSCQVDVY